VLQSPLPTTPPPRKAPFEAKNSRRFAINDSGYNSHMTTPEKTQHLPTVSLKSTLLGLNLGSEGSTTAVIFGKAGHEAENASAGEDSSEEFFEGKKDVQRLRKRKEISGFEFVDLVDEGEDDENGQQVDEQSHRSKKRKIADIQSFINAWEGTPSSPML
jgi:hypothetical protein